MTTLLLPRKFEPLLDADGPEKFRAKDGLTEEQKIVLREFDAEYYEYNDEHIITNYHTLK